METNWYYIAGIICGIAFAGAICAILTYRARKENKDCKYDEMQLIARHRAGMHAFILLLAYNLLGGVLVELEWCDGYTAMFLGAILAVTVFGCESILTNAYFRVGEKRKSWYVLFAAVAAINYLTGIRNTMVDGFGTFPGGASLLCGAAMTILMIVCVFQSYREKRELEDE